jgi:two-component system, sensor histidine kinase
LARVSSLLRLKLECDRLQLAAQTERDSLNDTLRDLFSIVSRNLGASVEDLIDATQLLVSTELTPEQSVHARTVLACSQKLLALTNDLLDIDRVNSEALATE